MWFFVCGEKRKTDDSSLHIFVLVLLGFLDNSICVSGR